MGWVYLGIAIFFEVSAALCLKYTVPVPPDEKYKIGPGILMIIFYILCFLAMIQAVKTLPLGLMYAIWGGVGTAAIALLSWQIWGEHMPMMKVAGIALIVMGVMLANLAKEDPKKGPSLEHGKQMQAEPAPPSETDISPS